VALSPDFEHDRSVFAGAPGGVLRSLDAGQTWYITMLPSSPPSVSTLVVSPNFVQDGVLLAGTTDAGVFSSADRGKTWTHLGETVINDVVNASVLSPDYPTRPDILVMLGTALLISRDNGQSWSAWLAGLLLEQGLSALAAPYGLETGAPLLVGLVEDGVRRIG
jgi:photosystem II stability/assembly factor-like uncharacterized protein